VRKINIEWPNGVWFANPKIKEVSGFMTSRSRVELFWVSGFSNYLPKKGCPKPSYKENT
jgi:hypothetical protein